ncbi:class I SAM-dependent methyltransferase [Thermomonospora cellulosilytica]|uniref:SAM-dependent methyltransferase n=1 Tax=Thermomonospora cellulosilytica TaxID=1411118 RepID=A0A7W3MVS6_9ACTN|nr:class I SAM-dependent methyltransferase [Thermomonospora cellulosilytica]MBA9002801.1 SAM-dependent methyltransferase [Thermomonospora cellulosilytica]
MTTVPKRRRQARRARHWHHHGAESAAFETVRDEILRLARPGPEDIAVDLRAGSDLLTAPLARTVRTVLAVDASQAPAGEVSLEEEDLHRATVLPISAEITAFAVPRQSVDLVVSNYVMHHLHNADKRAVVASARRWLRPGGRLVIGDMMFGRGLSSGDAQILQAKVRSLASKGPGGLWRIAKNLARYGLHIGGSHPAPPKFWITALEDAGFREVGHVQVVQEAGIVWGTA